MDFGGITYYVVTVATMSIGGVVGYIGIINHFKKTKEEERMSIVSQLKTETSSVKEHIDERLKTVDSRFEAVDDKLEKDREDIKDIEVDMKQMIYDFKDMCAKLQKHDYIIESVTPEFKILQKDFYEFKAAVEVMTDKKSPTVSADG